MTKTIRQTVTIGAPPKVVFGALINEKRHARFTGHTAAISRKVGGTFTCYGGYISGINLELAAPRRIVQAWRSQTWPDGVFSIVTFALSRKKGGRTKLSFTQVGVPASDFRDMSKGWPTYYWEPLKAHLEK
jgi:uncharacterized protein YndB with AHSA1/START domain